MQMKTAMRRKIPKQMTNREVNWEAMETASNLRNLKKGGYRTDGVLSLELRIIRNSALKAFRISV